VIDMPGRTEPDSGVLLFAATPRRALVILWTLMALANLGAGLVIASSPGRQSDLESVQRWGAKWLAGVNVYGDDQMAPDYPPNAIVALSPLGAVSAAAAVPLWAAFNIGLALLAPYLAVRASRPAARHVDAALLMAMFVCWGGFRTLLQFSLLALTLGLLAMILADRRPGWSAVCLGLALVKPQVAAPFFAWMVFTRHWRNAATALMVAAAGFAVFCVRVQADPTDVVRNYGTTLHMYYAGDAIMTGLSDLRPLIVSVAPNSAMADGIAAAIALVMLGAICVLGFREGREPNRTMYSAPSLLALWCLLTFYHLTYGFVLLLPAAALLVCADDCRTRAFRAGVFWVLQAALVVDIPGVCRRIGHSFPMPAAVTGVLENFDRGLMLFLFVCIAALSWMQSSAAAGRLDRMTASDPAQKIT
jgi:hypothetical protein